MEAMNHWLTRHLGKPGAAPEAEGAGEAELGSFFTLIPGRCTSSKLVIHIR